MSRHRFPNSVARSSCVTMLCAAMSSLVLAACGTDATTQPGPTPSRGIVVLDGFVQPGYTLLGDTGTVATKVTLGSATEFDAGAFTLERDTALAVSSRGAGDVLFITDIRAGVVRKVQLPVGGNGAKARLLSGGNGNARIIVALRDSQTVVTALVPPAAGGAVSFTRIENAGRCPVDAFRFGDATWVIDANADCRTDYSVQGPVRLIRVPDDGSTRDTLVLTSVFGSDAHVVITNEVAYVSAGGEADFGAFPFTLIRSGAIARVNLQSRQILSQKSMPAMSYGASMKLGLDGQLYVSLYENLDTFTNRVLQLTTLLDIAATAPTSPAGFRLLFDVDDAEITCGSATADAVGRLHCLVAGAAGATTLVVFDTNGDEVRRVSAGQGGVDLALRP